MGMIIVEDGKVLASRVNPPHDATLHDASAITGEVYSRYFQSMEEGHTSTLTGNGTYTNTANVVKVGVGIDLGTSKYESDKKHTLSARVTVLKFKISAIANGNQDERYSFIGMRDDLVNGNPAAGNGLFFFQNTINGWLAYATKAGVDDYAAVTIVAGDILTIAATTTNAWFYVNDILVFTTTNVPTVEMSIGLSVVTDALREGGAARELSIVHFGGSYLPISGGTMTGVLAMGANAITTSSTVDGVDVSALNQNFNALYLRQQTLVTLTPGATVALDASLGSVFRLVPAQSCTINVTNVQSGHMIFILIHTSGTSSYTVTFGTAIKSTGTFTTGTTDNRDMGISCIADATQYIENDRMSSF